MKINGFESNEMILTELGQRVKDTRLAMNYSLKEMAEKSGVSQRTLSRIESGESANMENYINVFRALGALPNLELLLAEQMIRPTDLADNKAKRKRASKSRKAAEQETWTWGDEEL